MKSISFTIITLLSIGALGVGGYFALRSLKDPSLYVSTTTPRIGDLHRLETDPQSTIIETPEVVIADVPKTQPVESEENDLKANIQSLINNKTILKMGSKGIAVGYVQQFMNLYFKKSLKVDNDFGKTLETNVKTFQKAFGVTQTGQIGPATLGKMVDWLNKNPQ